MLNSAGGSRLTVPVICNLATQPSGATVLAATVDGSGHLVSQHWGTLRTGPLSKTISATADALKALGKLRGKRAVTRTAA